MFVRRAHTVVSLVVLLALLVQPVGASASLTTPTETVSPANATGPADPGFLFRASVVLEGARTLARLEKTGAQVLSTADVDRAQTALILVDGDLLADLARLGFRPVAADALQPLIAAQGPEKQWLAAGLRPLLEQAAAVETARQGLDAGVAGAADGVAAEAQKSLRAALQAVTPEQAAALADSFSLDDDGDGLTNTQETWWCTDPADDDTDDDGRKDGTEIQALKDWMANKRAGPPFETPWPNWPAQRAGCDDKDHDSIPNLAERYELGLNMDLESTDRDKFDDGQELFGVTYCPGGDQNCGYGDLPRSSDSGYVGATMPSWVKAPGNHPLVAAFPVPEVDVVASSLHVQTVTTVTTDHVIGSGTEKSYSTAKTEGTSTSVANTTTWNEWQEVSVATTTPVSMSSIGGSSSLSSRSATPSDEKWDKTKLEATVAMGLSGVAVAGACLLSGGVPCAVGGLVIGIGTLATGGLTSYGDMLVNRKEAAEQTVDRNQLEQRIKAIEQQQNSCGVQRNGPLLQRAFTDQPTCTGNVGVPTRPQPANSQAPAASEQQRALGGRKQIGVTVDSRAFSEVYQQVSFPLARPTQTDTSTSGKSWGGAQTTTSGKYEEHTVTNGEAFSTNDSWGTATAVDSSHAADLWFTYKVRNAGTEYARQIKHLAFNIYIGESPNPACTYHVGSTACGVPVDTVLFSNFMPDEEHTYTSFRVPLTLEQMKAIDLGGPVRIVVEDFDYGTDELFYQDAAGAGVQFAIEDGTADGDEAVDSYLIPTWGSDTVLDVLGRHFPHTTDADGMLIAVWTPEYRADTPAWCGEPNVVGIGSQRTLWCKHALSTADWWNVYTNGMGDGSEGFQDTQAAAGQTALFRFNADSDFDGYSDRSEVRLGTDPDDPASYPQPELLAGVNSVRSGRLVTATLSLLNTGLYDAYGVEAVMIAPNDTISITNNTVGGSGRVRAQKQIIVGSRIVPQTPLPAAWLAAGHAQPTASGYYTGTTDLTYTFTVGCANAGGCAVGTDAWTLAWNDGKSVNGSLPFDST